MSHVSSEDPRESAKTPTASPGRPNKLSRPGWTEIATEIAIVVSLAVMFAVLVGGLVLIMQLGLGPLMYGLLLR